MAPAILVLAVFFAALVPGAGLRPRPASDQSSVMSLGSSLTPLGRNTLVSHGNQFSFGFRSLSQAPDHEFYVAIWYTNLDNTIVWVANRDDPVSRRAVLTLTANGDLVLSDPSPVWRSATSGLVTAEIQATGNFVLLSSSGDQVWQSFDNPTDTLLPGQQFKGKAQLISRKKNTGYASGRYRLHFSTSGNVVLSHIDYNFGLGYWRAESFGISSTMVKLNQSGILTVSSSSGESNDFRPDFQAESIRRLTLDIDGNLRMYSWDESSSSWTRVWFAVTDQCKNIKGLCGKYGICIYNPNPACVCPPGFRFADPNDSFAGCTPNRPINCRSRKYVELDNTDFPFNDYRMTPYISMGECLQSCSADCHCLAAVYWQSGQVVCWLKHIQILNGFSPANQNPRTFLKVSDSDQSIVHSSFDQVVTHGTSGPSWQQTNSVCTHTSTNNTVVLLILSVLIVAVLVFLRKKAGKPISQSKPQGDLEDIFGSPVMFSYHELEVATKKFSERLGSGGFGTVYKGILANGRAVAVKCLADALQREIEFEAELATIGKIHHINLLRLCGFCAEGRNRVLVYDYMENRSLDSILFPQPREEGRAILSLDLGWKTRFEICLGTARGISYLHQEFKFPHCHIKPQNILLDNYYSPKVADFGLAWLCSRDPRRDPSRASAGEHTRDYLPPEWKLANLPITTKADVYSFGMVALEIVSGRSNSLGCLAEWMFQQYRKVGLQAVLDPRLNGVDVDYEQVEAVLDVAFRCIDPDVSARLSMGTVVQRLEEKVRAEITPDKKLP